MSDWYDPVGNVPLDPYTYTPSPRSPRLPRVQRCIIIPGGGEVVVVDGVAAVGGIVRGHVDGVGGDRHRVGEVDLLPARGGFVGEGGGGQQRRGGGPEVADVRAGVARPLVEPDAGDIAGDVGLELDPQIDGAVSLAEATSGVTELFQRVYRPAVENDQLTGPVILLPDASVAPLTVAV